MKVFGIILFGFLCLCINDARPAVRTLRTHAEFQKLVNHHKENTGLPVVVDFFSESCGPCRMVAPHFKNLAKEYKDKAVFAKVDVNMNRETSGRQQIGSMPTFQFFMEGKKVHQFSGADVNQLRQFTEKLSRDFERDNVKITMDDLRIFYEKYAPEKADEASLTKIIEKAGGEKGGKGHRKLAEALRKKYKTHPLLSKRYTPNQDTGETEKKPGKSEIDLEKIPTEFLLQELKKRDAMECSGDTEDDDEEEEEILFVDHESSEFAERVVIIGSGPAGLSAAIYAARANLHPVIVAPREGGQLQSKGVIVENYPGVDERTGPEVVFEMMKQASKYGASFAFGKVMAVDLNSEKKKIEIMDDENKSVTLESQSVIVASGSDANWLNIEGEEDLKGSGVSACATCDGLLFANREVAVIGGGDSAMEEALYLSQTSSKVYIVHRGSSFRASHILQKRVLENEKIEVVYDASVVKFNSVERWIPSHVHEGLSIQELERLELEAKETEEPNLQKREVLKSLSLIKQGEAMELSVSGAFVAIGHSPNTEFLNGAIDLDDNRYIIVQEQLSTRTNVNGVFACGDVADSRYRQAVTSAGTGAMAALETERYLTANGFKDEKEEAERAFMEELLSDFGVA